MKYANAFKLKASEATQLEGRIAKEMHTKLGTRGKIPHSPQSERRQAERALRAQLNRQRIVNELKAGGPMTCAQLADLIDGLNKSQISNYLSDLRRSGKASNIGKARNSRIWEAAL